MPISRETIEVMVDRFRRGEISPDSLRAFHAAVKAESAPSVAGKVGRVALDIARPLTGTLGAGALSPHMSQREEAKGFLGGLVRGGKTAFQALSTPLSEGGQAGFFAGKSPQENMEAIGSMGAVAGGMFGGTALIKAGLGFGGAKIAQAGSKIAQTVAEEASEQVAKRTIRGATQRELEDLSQIAARELEQEKMFPFAKRTTQREKLQSGADALKAQRARMAKGKRPSKKLSTALEPIDNRIADLEARANQELNKELFPFQPHRSVSDIVETPIVARRNVPEVDLLDLPVSDPNNITDASRGLVRRMAAGAVAPIKAFGRPTVLMDKFHAGRVFNRLAGHAEDVGRRIESRARVPIDDAISGLTRKDKKWVKDNFRTDFRRGRKMPNERIQLLADQWDDASKRIATEAEEAGLEFGRQNKFMPDYWTDQTILAFEARKGALWNSIVDWLKKNKNIDEDKLKGIVERILPRNSDLPIRQSSSLEFRKVLGLPDQITVNGRAVDLVDRDALRNMGKYIRDNSRRIGTVSAFGKGDKGIRQVLDLAGDNTKNRRIIQEQWRVVQGIGKHPEFYTHPLGRTALGFEAAFRGLQLSGSVIANLTGSAQTVLKYGLRNTLRAQRDVLLAYGADKFKPSWFKNAQLRVQMARMEGGWAKHTLDRMAQAEGFGAAFGTSQKVGRAASTVLKATGLELVERNTNKLSALAAQSYVADLFNRMRAGKAGRLRQLVGADEASLRRALKRDFGWSDDEMTRIMKEGLNQNDRVRVSRMAPALTNAFAEGSGVRPVWMRHPVAQRALAYTSFVRIRGNMASDAIREIGHGNVKPIVRLLGYGALAGEAEIALKGWFKDRERVDKNLGHRIFNDLMASATFGYLGAVYEDAKYAGTSSHSPSGFLRNFAEGIIVPPFASGIMQVTEFIESLFTGKDIVEKKARRVAPAIDVIAAQTKRIVDPREARNQRRDRAETTRARIERSPLP